MADWKNLIFGTKKQVDNPDVDIHELKDAGVKVDKSKYKEGFKLQDLSPMQQKKLRDYRKS